MMATTETLRSVLRTSRGQPILKLQSAEQRVIAKCPFMSSHAARHPEYGALLDR